MNKINYISNKLGPTVISLIYRYGLCSDVQQTIENIIYDYDSGLC